MIHRDGWSVFATPAPGKGDPVGAPFTLNDGTELFVTRGADGRLQVPFDVEEAYMNYLTEAFAAASDNPRLSPMQLALFYRLKRAIPRSLQLRARRAFTRRQGTPNVPSWPVDHGVYRLLELYALTLVDAERSELPFRWFWPHHFQAAAILTHDVEGKDGVPLALELADLEQELGFRSAFNFGGWYRVDPGVLRELSERGFEIGLHGLVHDRSLFASRDGFEQRLPELKDLAEKLGAVGFRSPATHRVYDWLSELPVEYDCTIPHSDPYEPQPGGCCSLWPFFLGDSVVELPYTLPQDHTLLTLLGHDSPDLWLTAASTIEGRFGLIQCVTHPDPGYLGDQRKRDIYAEFLRAMAERPHVWRALPREVAAWWRRRDAEPRPGEAQEGWLRGGTEPHGITIEAPSPAGAAPGPSGEPLTTPIRVKVSHDAEAPTCGQARESPAMRVWIDIENPPQVQYLAPLKRGFEARGHTVTVTAMNNSITLDLLEQRDITPLVVGSNGGSTKARKVARIVSRAARLDRHLAFNGQPNVLVAASRAAALAAWTMRVPSFTFCDYEHVDLRVLRRTNGFVLYPDMIDEDAFIRQGIRRDRLLPFPGLKEAISFNGVDLATIEPHPLDASQSLVRVLFRPPGEETHYYVPESRKVALDLLAWLARRDDTVVVYSPRYPHQVDYLRQFDWVNEPIVLCKGVPFLNLLQAVDVVISSGGTMLREAAYLGLPAYSIFRSKIGQVDRHLESIGRLVILDSPASFARISIERRRLAPLETPDGAVGDLLARMEHIASANASPAARAWGRRRAARAPRDVD